MLTKIVNTAAEEDINPEVVAYVSDKRGGFKADIKSVRMYVDVSKKERDVVEVSLDIDI